MGIVEQAKAIEEQIERGIQRFFSLVGVKQSSWTFVTSGGVAAGGTVAGPWSVGGSAGVLEFTKNDKNIYLAYLALGAGVSRWSTAWNATYSPMSAWNHGTGLYLLPGNEDFETVHDFMLPGTNFGPVVMLTGDVGLGFEFTGTLLLLGVNFELIASLKRLIRHSHEMAAIAGKTAHGLSDSINLTMHQQIDLAKIEADVAILLAQLYMKGVMNSVRGAMVIIGKQYGVAKGVGATLSFGGLMEVTEAQLPALLKDRPHPEVWIKEHMKLKDPDDPLPPEVEKQMYTNAGGIDVENWPTQ